MCHIILYIDQIVIWTLANRPEVQTVSLGDAEAKCCCYFFRPSFEICRG